MKCYYRDKRTFLQWSEGHIIGYLNEEVVKDYAPDNMEGMTEQAPFDAFCYDGTEADGGTIMLCSDISNRDELANAIIRSRYSESAEAAVKRHHMLLQDDPKIAKADEYIKEWSDFNSWCSYAVNTADSWIN